MQKVDLGRIMETAKLKTSKVGEALFPDNREPSQAVRRVMRGDALLNSEQLAKLAELIGVPVGMLFDTASWKMSVPAGGRNIIQFRSYDYFAELDTKTMTTTVSFNGLVFFEKITHPHGVGIEQYLSDLTDLVIKYK
jgi:hypothetical protein